MKDREEMPKVVFLMLTFNRLQYTKEALEALFSNTYPFDLVIHDNGSTESEMIDYLKELKEREKRVLDIIFSTDNQGIILPTNAFWKSFRDQYVYLGKLDNDTIVPRDGVARLVDIMDHCPKVGVCHGYHWFDENFPLKRLKIINGRVLLSARWGGGCFYLMRSSIVHRYGYISPRYGKMGGWTEYQMKIRWRGNRIVYAYPLVKVQHLGDVKSGRPEETSNYAGYYRQIKTLRRMRNE